jgi:GDPmannose 4,6-dehydratase
MAVAIVTGANGQLGSHLIDLLLEKSYTVVGTTRRRAVGGLDNLSHVTSEKFHLEQADIIDSGSINRLVEKWRPDEFYNLAAMSFVKASWNEPFHTGMVTGLGVTNCLEALRQISPTTRFYQASSSEMYGKVQETPQRESTPFYPRSPYAAAKLYGYWITRNYRESYGMFAANGILFNSEGPRRGLEFVTRKITDGVARIKLGLADKLTLGNLAAKRDWGHAKDSVEAIWRILQHSSPDDFVIATGKTHSVADFCREAFHFVGINDWERYVQSDTAYMRPAEVDLLCGDATKIRETLGWQPLYFFSELVAEMVRADLKRLGG